MVVKSHRSIGDPLSLEEREDILTKLGERADKGLSDMGYEKESETTKRTNSGGHIDTITYKKGNSKKVLTLKFPGERGIGHPAIQLE